MAKILLVEDDKDTCVLVSDILKLQSHLVEFVHSGSDAENLLDVFEYDLIILDWGLPDVSGDEVCKRFRARKGNTPVLMLTGKNRVAEKTAGLDAGADDYLTKPFDSRELIARVRALLRRPGGYADNSITIGDVKLDSVTMLVTKSGAQVKLYPRDFALLQFLMRHPNRLFSAEALIERVWSTDTAVGGETVRSCIKRLREKLDSDGKPSLIETVHGMGYRLRTPADSN